MSDENDNKPGERHGDDANLLRAVRKGFDNLKEKMGGPEPTGFELYRQTYEARREIDELRSENEKLRKGQLGKDHVALPKAEAEELAKYRELGAFEELTTTLASGKDASSKLTLRQQTDAMREAAKAHGLNADGLLQLKGVDGLTVTKKTETVDGAEVPVFYVKPEGDDATETRLDAYVKANFSDAIVSSLTAEPPKAAVQHPRVGPPSTSKASNGNAEKWQKIADNAKNAGVTDGAAAVGAAFGKS